MSWLFLTLHHTSDDRSLEVMSQVIASGNVVLVWFFLEEEKKKQIQKKN